ncbi:formimidoylglutamase [Pandoraea captiosa]|uniref:Formimidoylglutamase n=1 Tax=Pandoraea captiosa TaxID=2508302 RepID=A0A5E5AK47_9BURK|nr:formimidoylglutamase [Pandoraea captiosa]VVE73172.1 formimidoylglutamase [Pandoraea captiosa]
MTIDRAVWQGRVDTGEAGHTLRLHQVLRDYDACDASEVAGGAVVLGFCSDEGVRRNHGRQGAVAGPDMLRRALASLPVQGTPAVFDGGNIVCADDRLEAAQAALGHRVAEVLAAGARPVVLGGGHEIAYGTFLGVAEHFGDRLRDEPMLILNFDAHFDLRAQPTASSGTPFWQISQLLAGRQAPFHYACLGVSRYSNTEALFERATALNVDYWLDETMLAHRLPQMCEQLEKRLAKVSHVYLTIDMDVLPGEKAPGVSAPAAHGVALEVIEALVGVVRRSGKLRVADIAEYNPTYDRDGLTARVGARLLHPLITQLDV